MATPDWLEGPGKVTRIVGANHPIYANTKDRCGQTIQAMLEVGHTGDGVHLARATGMSLEIDTFAGNGAARTITLSNTGLTPIKAFVWETNPATNLVTNGGFDSDTTGWTAQPDAILASVAGGQSGNCLDLSDSDHVGTNWGYQTISGLLVGQTYSVSGYVKNGTDASKAFQIVITGLLTISGTTTASWVQHSGTFIATATTCEIKLIQNYTPTAGSIRFDTIVVAQAAGNAPAKIDIMTIDKTQPSRYTTGAWAVDAIDNFQAGSFDVEKFCNTSGVTNYYCVIGVDADTVPVGDTGAGSDPDWIESSVLNRIIADNSAVLSTDNIANYVESQIWTQFIEEHTAAGAHSITLQHIRVDTVSWTGNDGDDRVIACNITDLDIMHIEVYRDGLVVSTKTSDMVGDTTKLEATAAFQANYIQDITTNGQFTVGTALNASGQTYIAYMIGV